MNQCAFPNCTQTLTATIDSGNKEVSYTKPIVLGEEAHIVAEEDNGPRGDPTMPIGERNAYLNLILLCPTHHTQIDKDKGAHYTVRELHDMKRIHEDGVNQILTSASSHDQMRQWRREELLLEAASASRGRLIARWAAVGVNADLAQSLADDESIGLHESLGSQTANARLMLLEGSQGAGKSVSAERLHAKHIADALANVDAPIPIWLSAQTVTGTLLNEVKGIAEPLGRPQQSGVRVIVDGLDEPGPARASQLLDEIRALAHTWPDTRIIATVRPGLLAKNDDNRIEHPILTNSEATSLVERLGANESALWSESPVIRRMLHLPLFAIIAARRQLAGAELPRSQGAFLSALADEALKRNPGLYHDTLRALKHLSCLTVSLGGSAPIAELDIESANLCLESRLVVRGGRTLRFALPVLEQYFAAQAVLELGLDSAINLEDLKSLDRWRYPLLVAMTVGSWIEASALIEGVIAKRPGLASWLVASAIPQFMESPESQLPNELECARRLQRSLDAWTASLGIVAQLLEFRGIDGERRFVGVDVRGNHLTAAFNTDRLVSTKTTSLPRDLNPFTGRAPDGSTWTHLRMSAASADFPSWPWRWTLDWLSAPLGDILKAEALPLVDSDRYLRERKWALTRALIGKESDLLHRPIRVADVVASAKNILAKISEPGQCYVQLGRAHGIVTDYQELTDLIDDNSDILQRDDEFFQRPYQTPDKNPSAGGLIQDLYTPESLRILVEQVQQSALCIYEDIVDTYLPHLKATLGIGCILPVKMQCNLSIRKDSHIGAVLDYAMEPIPPGQSSNVEVALTQRRATDRLSFDEMIERGERIQKMISAIHPGAEGWAHPRIGQTVVYVYRNYPATRQAYRWLWEDLKALKMVNGLPPHGED